MEITEIIEQLLEKQDKTEIAKQLFPENQYPAAALNRVLKGESFLNTQHLERLAAYLGVPISTLFNKGWDLSIEKGYLVFIKGKYRASVNCNGSFLEVTRDNKIIEQTIINTKAISLCEFINHLNKLTDGTD